MARFISESFHDEDLRLFLPAARRILLKHLAGDDDAVLPDLGLIHQPVGLPDHGIHAVAWHLDQPPMLVESRMWL